MNKKMIGELTKEILKFRGKRDWGQLHDQKNVIDFSLDVKSVSGKPIYY